MKDSTETDERWSVAREQFKEDFSKNQILFVEACDAFQGLVKMLLSSEFPSPPKVTGRVKERDECIKKFELKYLPSRETDTKEQYKIMPEIGGAYGRYTIRTY